MVGRRIIAHRFGQTALLLEPVVAFLFQFADSVDREEFARDAVFRQFPSDGLGAVFAKLE